MLPDKISATNIEILLRNPYGFYAKNILKLRKLDDIWNKKSLSKFGNFIHQIIEKYTLEFDDKIHNKFEQILEIGHCISNDNYNGDQQVNLWWPKFVAIAREFVDYDLERRADCAAVLPEAYGEMTLELGSRSILITAIADRIEVKRDGAVHILDYKTGSLPSKVDILSGISSQMLIEAMIVDARGFKKVTGVPSQLVYVKIGSSAPYVREVCLDLAEIDLGAHRAGLIKILTHYSAENEFKVNHNSKFAPRYDDYRHLTRKD